MYTVTHLTSTGLIYMNIHVHSDTLTSTGLIHVHVHSDTLTSTGLIYMHIHVHNDGNRYRYLVELAMI